MDDLYTLHSSMLSYPNDDNDDNDDETPNLVGDGSCEGQPHHQQLVLPAGAEEENVEVGMEMMSDVIKTQIANHPLYPNLLSAYIDCTKVSPFFFFFILFLSSSYFFSSFFSILFPYSVSNLIHHC